MLGDWHLEHVESLDGYETAAHSIKDNSSPFHIGQKSHLHPLTGLRVKGYNQFYS